MGVVGVGNRLGSGRPIVEREGISLMFENGDWIATALGHMSDGRAIRYFDYSPLVAAMRCYVASSFGDEIEVPDELLSVLWQSIHLPLMR